jgi:two-component system, chemotaxis family, sensor kinase CheA
MIDQDFLAIFLDEAVEILERWEASCLELEKQSSTETLNALFRSAHNIKGSSRSVGLEAFGAFVHKVEDLITKLKNNELNVSSEIISVLFDAQKILADWIEKLRETQEFVPNTDEICIRLLSLQGQSQKSKLQMEEEQGFGFFDDEPSPTPKTAAESTDIGSILIQTGKVTQAQIEEAVNAQNRKLGEVLVDAGVVSPELVKSALEQQKASGHKADETIRVSLRKLDSIIRLIGELSIQHAIVRNAKDSQTLHDAAPVEAINLAHKVIQDLQSEAREFISTNGTSI